MTRRKPTNPDTGKWRLTPQQHAAVDLLAAGSSVTDTAAAVAVGRQTVSEWLHHHHGFRAALNQRRRELWVNVSDRLLALLPKALTVLEREIEDGDAKLTTALHVLKACAVYGTPPPIGSTDPKELELLERERAAQQQQRDLLAF